MPERNPTPEERALSEAVKKLLVEFHGTDQIKFMVHSYVEGQPYADTFGNADFDERLTMMSSYALHLAAGMKPPIDNTGN